MIVIAGPNGCGKSCLFDALRLLKSAYGGYSDNEWQQWFGEFQIRLDRRQQHDIVKLFHDPDEPVIISADVELHEEEKQYLREHGADLIRPGVWRSVAPETAGWAGAQTAIAAHLRTHGAEVEERTQQELALLQADLQKPVHHAEFSVGVDRVPRVMPSVALQTAWSLYLPKYVGVMDYHGPHRNYQREDVGGINLSLDSSEQQLSQHALYNYANKYTNIKTQMATSYVRDLLAQEAGEQPSDTSITDTLKELFDTFFPGKEFLGPRPAAEGHLDFPVRLQNGREHDINDLSSGEKEVLYGYLRLHDAAPRRSLLLLDEPELHLNPRLIQGLPQFYHRHLGSALGNQIWLLTHSDALLREALGRDGFALFHMQSALPLEEGQNQLTPVTAAAEADRAVIDLVGDLAAYAPGAKVVIFEGGGNSEFDRFMVTSLFPELAGEVNTISGGDRTRVRELHALLETARDVGALHTTFFSIVDRDSDSDTDTDSPARFLAWDVYHIENYLLEPAFILEALKDALGNKAPLKTEAGVQSALKRAAASTLSALVSHQLQLYANSRLVSSLNTRIDPRSAQLASPLREAVEKSAERMTEVVGTDLSLKKLKAQEKHFRTTFEKDLESENWRRTFRGRDVLANLVQKHGSGINYETLRNLIVARMRDSSHRPKGMQTVISQILDA